MFRDRVLAEKLDAHLRLSDERHDRTMEILNDVLRSVKDLRETQLTAKKNGNGAAAAAAANRAAVPGAAGAGGAGLLYLLQTLLQ